MEGQIWETDPDIQAELQAMAGCSKSVLSDKGTSDTPKRKVKKRKSKLVPKKPKPLAKIKETAPTSTIGAVDQMELINIIKQPAFTSEEKYKVLEARDKLIRLKTKKNTDISSAKHIVGTCPDMCPERERLMREVQHQVSLYEQEPGEKTMNPFLAVKQYSRSSADQEVPLPHELRPVAVLERTMSYLLQRIADLCDNPDINLAEWYHFLWDRTRGIRKDITQQELCCKGSVELVEQCARFHIHCSARLVAEDRSVFDQKINTENLTKCLQTLKYMYHDLELNNESCRNEAEFRAYVILLNLNDGNFMWEVQQLKKEIQKSKEVQFALDVYSALDKRNYVRFFNLVRSTTYLNACILLRYFVQIRLQALKTIVKSHSPRTLDTLLPLEETERILAFEGIASTIDFIEYHGLNLNESRTHIIINRRSFRMPEVPYSLDRAMKLIESKRQCIVGEIISGKPLEYVDFERYIPHDSFDPNGLINISDYLPDLDLATLQRDSEKNARKEAKIVSENEKAADIFGKNTQAPLVHSNVFALKSSSDSRSNSPMDTVDRGLEIKSEPVALWCKTESKSSGSIFKMKVDNVSQRSIFMLQQEKSQSLVKPIGHQNQTLFGSTAVQSGSIFTQNTQQLIKPDDKKENLFKRPVSKTEQNSSQVSTNFFRPSPMISTSNQLPSFSNRGLEKFEQKPITSIFKPITTGASGSTGGFMFNLKTTKPSTGFLKIDQAHSIQPSQQKPSIEHQDHLKEQKQKAMQMQKQLEDKIKIEKERFENEKRRRLEEEQKLTAEKREITRRKMEEEIARKNLEEEMARRRMREEMERKRMEERRRIEKLKQLEESRRKMREMEERRNRDVLEVMEDLIEKVEDGICADKLKSICQKIRMRKASFYFTKWKNSVVVNRRKRKAIDQWPIWVNFTTPQEEAHELRSQNQDENLKYMKRYRGGLAIDIAVDRELKMDKINLVNLTRRILSKKFKDSSIKSKTNFLKIDVVIASLSYMTNSLKWLERILADFFDWVEDVDESVEECKILTSKLIYCFKRLKNYKEENTDGFIFIGDDLSDEFYNDIKKITKSSKKKHVQLPIVILLQDKAYDAGKLDDLQASRYIGKYNVVSGRYTPGKLAKLMEDSLLYLAENAVGIPPIELDLLKAFLHKYLASEIWRKMSSYAKWNQPYRTCLKNPEVVISLYNEAVSRLECIVFDQNSMEYGEFPQEFHSYLNEEIPTVLPCDYKYIPAFWKNDSYRRKIRRVFSELTLPKFETRWPPKNVKELEVAISEFCAKFFKDPSKKIYKIIASILQFFDPTEDFDEIKHVLWSEVMEVLITEKLREIDYSLREPFLSQTVFDELFVVYNKNHLHTFETEAWFYLNNPIIEKELNIEEYNIEESEEDLMIVEDRVDAEDADIGYETAYLEVTQERFDMEEKINASKSDLKEFEILMADLEQSMTIQKKINRRFEETLMRALND